MLTTSPNVERVILVHINFHDAHSDEDFAEFKDLAKSSGALIVEVLTSTRATPDPKYFMGKGKAEELQQLVMHSNANLVLVNHSLSPSQERNLEQLIKCRVLDRSGLILDIFAQRARTFEGKLQVELAQLHYLSTKLIRGWTHLERQKGGIGLRGPGETQLETDRRLLRNRIKTINTRLQKVRSQRDQNRRARKKVALPTVSIVGYTNAGKSSLFNALTHSTSYVADQLFATLDATLRKVELPGSGTAIIADTVGFIRDLPHDLIEAFRATLEETRDANLLLHVIDVAAVNWRDTVSVVEGVLQDIGAAEVPILMVYNKIDLLADRLPAVEHNKVWVSATQHQGIDLLVQAIANHLYGDPILRTVYLKPAEGKLRAELYHLHAVLNERIDQEGNWIMAVKLAKKDFERLLGDGLIE